MFNLEKILNKIIYYGLYAVLFTPLTFWPKALFPFLTPKFILFQILIEIVFAAWLILKIIDFRNRSTRSPTSVALAEDVGLQVALFGFFAISFISALFGADFSRSFWGIGSRMTGLFAELHFLAWFLVLVSISKSGLRSPTSVARAEDVGLQELKSNFDIKKYLNFSFAIALLVALTAFYQNPQWGLSLGYGVFSNATFVTPYLIFHFFWGIYQTFKFNVGNRASNIKLWLFGGGTAFLFVSIILTQIRGAILGLLIGIFILGSAFIFTNLLSKRKRIIITACYLLLIVALIGFWNLRQTPLIQSFDFLKKISNVSLTETTVQTRILGWQTAIVGFKDRSLLGFGPENFNVLFNAHYNPELLTYGNGETWFDKPHNAFLEVLTETGIIGSLAYALIWLVVGLALYKLFKNGEKFLSLIMGSAFIAYFGAVFFSFDSFGSWFGLYLFLAILISSSSGEKENNFLSKINFSDNIKKIAMFMITIIAAYLILLNYSIWRANIADANALRIFPANIAQGVDSFKQSLNYFTPYKSEYRFDLASLVIGAIQKNIPIPDLENTLNFTLGEADKALAAHSKNAAYYIDMAKLFNILGEKGGDLSFLTQAEEYGKKSLKLSPKRQETLFYLAQAALLKGDVNLSLDWIKQAVDANPAIGQSHWYLGRLYIVKGQKAEGIIEIKRALELGYELLNQNEINFIKSLGIEIKSQ